MMRRMPRILIDDVADPRLAPYRDLPRSNLTRSSGLFVAEGEKVVERLIASRFEVASVLAEPEWAERLEPRLAAAVPIYVASKALLQQIVGFHFHRGVMACGRRERRVDLDERLGLVSRSETATIVVLPDVQDPTNLGSIIRTAAAFGCAAAILGKKCADPFSRRVLRVSMGAALFLPIIESRDLTADLQQLNGAGFELAATILDPAAEPLADFQRVERTAILFGSEGHGLSEEWMSLCQRCVTIPMQAGIDSLNVSIAAAVVLWQLCKVRPPSER